MHWDPKQYEKFAAQRAQPFYDLLSLVRFTPGMRIIDLGCGTGALTMLLRDASPGASIVGVDASPEMLAHAVRDVAGVRFVQADLRGFGEEGAYDLVLSNAALHWLDDHANLVPRLMRLARPGGQIAWQIPSNHVHPAHVLIHEELVAEEPYRSMLGGWKRPTTVLPVDEYARLLHRCGAKDIVAFEKVYVHELDSVSSVVDWTRATTLLPYWERMPAAWHERFLGRYRELLVERWGGERPYCYTFRRILLHAHVGAHGDPSGLGSGESSRSQVA